MVALNFQQLRIATAIVNFKNQITKHENSFKMSSSFNSRFQFYFFLIFAFIQSSNLLCIFLFN